MSLNLHLLMETRNITPKDWARTPDRGDSTQNGFFCRTSRIWTIDREMALLLTGGRALLMQLAHPKVAAGVAAHSRFQEDPLGRLYRTMSRMWSIVFDEKSQAREALRQVETVHRRVRGRVSTDEPAHAGGSYDASDQELLLWVHATLIDSAMIAYDHFVAPLNPAERAEYYDDSKKLAVLFGIHEENIPPSVAAFDTYMSDALTEGWIAAGPTARNLATEVLYPSPWVLRPAGPIFRLVTAGLLPETLRAGYGLEWNERKQKKLLWLARGIRALLPVTPAFIRIVPNARKSERPDRRPLIGSVQS
ncbi:MAG TPA: oxygenase MpaB family protein [Candidatus Binatia bacterium]|nr:oxygenase MpaB family protein [Candidatus Binatia bacterium]